jgi:hypothetical protein
MELDLPTPVSRPPTLGWCPRTAWHAQMNKVVKVAVHHLRGYAMQCSGTIQGKEGGIQVLAGLAQSSQTVGSNRRINGSLKPCRRVYSWPVVPLCSVDQLSFLLALLTSCRSMKYRSTSCRLMSYHRTSCFHSQIWIKCFASAGTFSFYLTFWIIM